MQKELTPEQQFAVALCKAQTSLKHALRDSKNPHFQSTFADLTSVLDAVRDPYTSNGFSIMQPITTEDSVTYVCTVLLHEGGHSVTSRMPLAMGEKAQAVGSFITYWRRYQLQSICGVGAEDDDGNRAQEASSSYTAPGAAQDKICLSQVAYMQKLFAQGDPSLETRFLSAGRISKIEDLALDKYAAAIAWINKEIVGQA